MSCHRACRYCKKDKNGYKISSCKNKVICTFSGEKLNPWPWKGQKGIICKRQNWWANATGRYQAACIELMQRGFKILSPIKVNRGIIELSVLALGKPNKKHLRAAARSWKKIGFQKYLLLPVFSMRYRYVSTAAR